MEALRIIPNIQTLLRSSKVDEAIDIINAHIDVLAPHMEELLDDITVTSSKSLLCLSKIHFVLQNYKKAIEYAIKAGNCFQDDGSFYYRSIVFRMMDMLRCTGEHGDTSSGIYSSKANVSDGREFSTEDSFLGTVKRFVTNLISSDRVSESLIGYLFEIEAYDALGPALKEYLETEAVDNPQIRRVDLHGNDSDYAQSAIFTSHSHRSCILGQLVSLAKSKGNLDKIYSIIIDINNCNRPYVYSLVDAYVHLNRTSELCHMFNALLLSDCCLAYELGFYVEDCYSNLKLSVEDAKLATILSGEFKRSMISSFMIENNLTSFKFLESISRSRTGYLSFVNSLMNLCTTNDTFYRNNAEIFGQGKEWSKFCEVSSLGMIHFSSNTAYDILKNYLPSESNQREGGALFATGLINAMNKNDEDAEFLLYFLDSESLNSELAHGSCLGLGFLFLGTCNNLIVDKMLLLSKTDSTLIAEAAVYGLGLLSLGSHDLKLIGELSLLAKETVFERVSRTAGISLCLILAMSEDKFYVHENNTGSVGSMHEEYNGHDSSESGDSGYASAFEDNECVGNIASHKSGSEENKSKKKHKSSTKAQANVEKQLNELEKRDEQTKSPESVHMEHTLSNDSILERKYRTLVNSLLANKNSILRCNGILCLGTAFVGTASLEIVSRLLPFVNDGDDDAKRATVISIALVCCNNQKLLIGILEPLAENHNTFVRGAVAICLGFFMAGTGDKIVCDILEALMYDSNNLVRQCASIGIGFVVMQCNPTLVTNYKRIVEKLNKCIVDRSEDSAVKFGALIGRGISEAGGRNMVFSIRNLSGKITPDRVAGVVLFLHYWYWYPLLSCISLNYLPTGFFCYNEDLEKEDVELQSSDKYDNVLIRLPDAKKSRRFKPKISEEKEIVTKSSEVVRSGKRCTLLQKREMQLSENGVFFVNKRQ